MPKLRFPEFLEAGLWNKSKAGTLFSNRIEDGEPELPIYSVTMNDGMAIRSSLDRRVNNIAEPEGNKKACKGDIAYNMMRMWQGAFGVVIEDCMVSPAYVVLAPMGGVCSKFFAYLLKLPSSLLLLTSHSQGLTSDRLRLYYKDFAHIPLIYPPLAEQQKIADCLSSIDELITAQNQKIDALQKHKQGLMRRLFPAEGETAPKLRFSEFQDSGEWEEKRIGDLKPFVTSGSRGWAAFYSDQGSLFVRITNLTRKSIYLDLTDSKFVKLPPKANEGVRTQLKEHDVLISITADIGIIGYVDASVSSPAFINQHIALVRFETSQVCGKFASYFLASEKSQRIFHASTDIGAKAGMSLIMVQKLKIMLPSLSEQQKIADCLSSIDALITAQTKKLETLKILKKGLMQQLFPSAEPAPI